jgi:hypothetical protein
LVTRKADFDAVRTAERHGKTWDLQSVDYKYVSGVAMANIKLRLQTDREVR